ncbi:MAG: hypothetical protein GIW99_02680 [Candidatus Eremiobacteraeota bacterium]|nr:hypothetical protein [Candidatus Eremiobacteraeota bacterium]MBC5826580.1 hypothetical protein [Candidatus Eremiobacteraeota bacterium]
MRKTKLREIMHPTDYAAPKSLHENRRDLARRTDGLTTTEREEIARLRREVKQLRLEREILSKAAAWFARETDAIPSKSSSS